MNQAEAVCICPETYEEVLVNTVRAPKTETIICGKKILLIEIAENNNWLEELNHLDLDHHDLTTTATTINTPTTTMPIKKSCFKSAIKATSSFSYCRRQTQHQAGTIVPPREKFVFKTSTSRSHALLISRRHVFQLVASYEV